MAFLSDITYDEQGRPWRVVNPVLCKRSMQRKDAKGKMVTVDASYTCASVIPAWDGEFLNEMKDKP